MLIIYIDLFQVDHLALAHMSLIVISYLAIPA